MWFPMFASLVLGLGPRTKKIYHQIHHSMLVAKWSRIMKLIRLYCIHMNMYICRLLVTSSIDTNDMKTRSRLYYLWSKFLVSTHANFPTLFSLYINLLSWRYIGLRFCFSKPGRARLERKSVLAIHQLWQV